jgi:hypothetical protein
MNPTKPLITHNPAMPSHGRGRRFNPCSAHQSSRFAAAAGKLKEIAPILARVAFVNNPRTAAFYNYSLRAAADGGPT